ncbi:hypothetical protein BDW62DRAFT_199187 [Aspergillus aurantiobrunneus]
MNDRSERLEQAKRLFIDPSEKKIKQITEKEKYLLRNRNMKPAESTWHDTDDSEDYVPMKDGKKSNRKRQVTDDEKRAKKRLKSESLEGSDMKKTAPKETKLKEHSEESAKTTVSTRFFDSLPIFQGEPSQEDDADNADRMDVDMVEKRPSEGHAPGAAEPENYNFQTLNDTACKAIGISVNNYQIQEEPKDNNCEVLEEGRSPRANGSKEDAAEQANANSLQSRIIPRCDSAQPKEQADSGKERESATLGNNTHKEGTEEEATKEEATREEATDREAGFKPADKILDGDGDQRPKTEATKPADAAEQSVNAGSDEDPRENTKGPHLGETDSGHQITAEDKAIDHRQPEGNNNGLEDHKDAKYVDMVDLPQPDIADTRVAERSRDTESARQV